MSESTTSASLRAVFKFPFQGPGWQGRFAVGSALVLAGWIVPIVPLVFVYGYVVQVMRRAIAGEALDLPVWDDWGRLGADGLRATVVGLVYILPGLIVYLGGIAVYLAATLALPLAESAGGDASVLFAFVFLGAMGILFVSLAAGCLLLVLGAIPAPVAVAHMVAKDRLAAGFRPGEWWRILRANWLGFFISWVIAAGLGAIVYLVLMVAYYSLVLCCLAPLLAAPASYYVTLVSAALFAQSYREGAEALAEAS